MTSDDDFDSILPAGGGLQRAPEAAPLTYLDFKPKRGELFQLQGAVLLVEDALQDKVFERNKTLENTYGSPSARRNFIDRIFRRMQHVEITGRKSDIPQAPANKQGDITDWLSDQRGR